MKCAAYLRDLLTNWPTLPRDEAGQLSPSTLAALLPRTPQPVSTPAG